MPWETVDSKTSGTLPADKGQFGQNNASEAHKTLPEPPVGDEGSQGEQSGEQQQVNQGPPSQEYGGERS